MILPEALNSAVRPAIVSAAWLPEPVTVIGSASPVRPSTRTDTDSPVASFICDATVRFQISS